MFAFDFEGVVTAAEFALTWWFQSGVLVAAGLLAAVVFRRRGAATESTVYKLTLLGAVICPLLAILLSLSGVSMLTIDLKSKLVSADPVATTMPVPVPVTVDADSIPFDRQLEPRAQFRETLETAGKGVFSATPMPVENSGAAPVLDAAGKLPGSQIAAANNSAWTASTTTFSWSKIYALLLAVWMLGTAIFSIRLLVEFICSRRLCLRAADADDAAARVCLKVAEQLRVRTPRVLVSPFVSSPCLFGHWRPAVVLPENTPTSSYNEVFLHELAHLRRSDWMWSICGRLATAVLWTQPLLWVLLRRSANTAEDVCDDYVLQHGGNRECYVQRLVEIAETRLPPQAIAGVAMVSFSSSLGKRVKRILDSTRDVSTTVGYRFVLPAIVAMLMLTCLVGSIYIGQPKQVVADDIQDSATAQKPASVAMQPTNKGDTTANDDATPQAGEKITLPDTITGRVVGVDGKPFAGADVYLEDDVFRRDWNSYTTKCIAETKSKRDGSYQIDVSGLNFTGNEQVVVCAAGFGLAQSKRWFLDKRPTLRLVADTPIEGRVLDSEGQPVAGIQIRVRRCVLAEGEEAVSTWIANKRPDLVEDNIGPTFNRDPALERTAFPGIGTINIGSKALPVTTTDAEGNFRLAGLGSNRKSILQMEGSGIATECAIVVTREMEPFKAYSHTQIGLESAVHHGASFQFVAGPTQPIVGMVSDKETREPLAGVAVHLCQQGKNTYSLPHDFIAAETDAAGKFRLVGSRLGVKRTIEFTPKSDSPYFETELDIKPLTSSGAAKCEMQLAKAVWLTGKVTNQDGQPVEALVQYYPYRDNEFVDRYANYDPIITGSTPNENLTTDADGRFRIRVIPGRGILAAKVTDRETKAEYLSDISDDLMTRIGGVQMPKLHNSWSARYFHVMREIEIAEDAVEFSRDVTVLKGQSHRLKIQDADGSELTSVAVMGRVFPPKLEKPIEGNDVNIIGLRPNDRRLIVLLHKDRKLGKSFILDEANRAGAVRLQKLATVMGRVVDSDGKGVADVVINATMEFDADNWIREIEKQTTKSDGRFLFHLPAGTPLRIWAYTQRGPNVSVALTPKAGANYDVGDLKDGVKIKQPKAAPRAAAQTTVGESAALDGETRIWDASEILVYEGQVLTADGKPAAGAQIYESYWLESVYKRLPIKSLATTDADGRFRFTAKNDSSERASGMIVVKHPNHDLAMRVGAAFESTGTLQKMFSTGPMAARFSEYLERDAGPIKLTNDNADITGRIVDLEGNGVPSVNISVLSIRTGNDGTLDQWESEAAKSNATDSSINGSTPRMIYGQMTPSLFPNIQTDGEGRFVVKGISKQRLVQFAALGKNIESMMFYARTGGGPRRDLPKGLNPSNWITAYFGDQVSLVASPAKPLIGRTTDSKTGKPIAGAVLTSMTTFRHSAPGGKGKRVGSSEVQAISDQDGNYRLDGLPSASDTSIRVAHPSYVAKEVTVDVSGRGGEAVKQDLKLVKGVRVTGRVVDAATGKGVAGRFTFLPLPSDQVSDLSFHLPSGRSNPSGAFNVLSPNTPGNLCFRANDSGRFSLVDTPAAQRTRMTVFRGPTYHAVHLIEKMDQEQITFNMSVQPLTRIVGTAVDEAGNELQKFLYAGRTSYYPRWTPSQNEAELFGLEKGQTRRVTAVDQLNKLAGFVDLAASDHGFRITMRPWATLKGQLLDEDGDPIANAPIRSVIMNPEKARVLPSGMVELPKEIAQPLPPVDELGNSIHATDDEGRFELIGMVPGNLYHLKVQSEPSYRSLPFASDIKLESGEARDLGKVIVKKRK